MFPLVGREWLAKTPGRSPTIAKVSDKGPAEVAPVCSP
jgi:hypothetical protein